MLAPDTLIALAGLVESVRAACSPTDTLRVQMSATAALAALPCPLPSGTVPRFPPDQWTDAWARLALEVGGHIATDPAHRADRVVSDALASRWAAHADLIARLIATRTNAR